MTDKIPQKIIDCFELESDICKIKELSEKQKDWLRRQSRASLNGVLYSEECIIFVNENTHKSWRYHSGFEYIEPWLTVNDSMTYLAAYDCTFERVEEIIVRLNEMEEEKNEHDLQVPN
jgi:hypothetical protein